MHEPASEPADPELSITRWFVSLREGERDAEAVLYSHFFPRLVALARERFDADRDPVAGADATAQSVFQLLSRGAQRGRFNNITDRDDLWRILVVATRRKVIDQTRRRQSLKRGGGTNHVSLHDVVAESATNPDSVVAMEEQMQVLMQGLRDDVLRSIAADRLAGFTNDEIAERLGVSTRTVERKLALIRDDWKKISATC